MSLPLSAQLPLDSDSGFPPTSTLAIARTPDDDACLRFLETLARENSVLCAKTYRVNVESSGLPLIPCLDHEASLRNNPAPHVSAYLKDSSGAFHEVAYIPRERSIVIDRAATLAETPAGASDRFASYLTRLFPQDTITQTRPSFTRGDRRVARVVRGQLRLHEVLEGVDDANLRWKLERLRAIADLMEKESRATSWAVRTLTPPLLTGASVGSYLLLGFFEGRLFDAAVVEMLRYLVLTLLGGGFLWWGMKAVHLTEMGSRVWKRSTEYRLILEARKRAAASKAIEPPRNAGLEHAG